MNITETQEETAKYVRLILPLMTKHGIPITPKNYTTWYYYINVILYTYRYQSEYI